jgi:uncharacterized protein with ParB-like and HNH nuclease domain
MDAHKTKLVSLFSGDEEKYVIPVYQRNYNWSTKQCKQLFNDICSVIEKDKEHFFGSVVLFDNRHETYTVIDGQQRLTTVSLMWLAMYRLLENGTKITDDDELMTKLRNKFGYMQRHELQSKMIHVEKDREAYTALLKGYKDKYVNESNITRNFNLFYDWIKNSEYSIEQFEKAVKGLELVKIELDDCDNPQLIFESLNSTGLALSDGDKIRNFILMNLSIEKQKDLYHKYWVDIEDNSNYTGIEKDTLNAVTYFVRDYLTMKTTRIPSLRDVYSHFKAYARDRGFNSEELLADMKKFSLYLYKIGNAKTSSYKINAVLKRLALLEMTVTHPFMFRLMDDFSKGDIDEKTTIDIMELIENFIFRRLICDVPTNALNKIFSTLYSTSKKLSEKTGISFYDALVYQLTSRTESGRFPSDKEFRETLATKNIYKMRAKNKIYIFFRLNAGKNAEGDTSVIDKMQQDGDNTLTIEHIMPQTLSPEWVSALGGRIEADRIQDKWENTIANLTLTGYNSSYSNNTFETKLNLTINGVGIGFKYSPLHINEFIKNQTEWGEQQLVDRLQMIQDEACNTLWKYPLVVYHVAERGYEELTLEDEPEDYTSTSFVGGTLDGVSIPSPENDSWKNVFVNIIKMLASDYYYDMVRIASDDSLTYLQNENNKYANSEEVLDGIYAYLNNSTASKIGTLNQIFSNIDLDLNTLVFRVRRTVTSES